jgi:hypothetical protein
MSYKTVRRDGVFGIDIPGLPGTMTPDTSTGIRRVPADQRVSAAQALNLFSFESPEMVTDRMGQDDQIIDNLVYVLFSSSIDWTTNAKSNGYVVMIPYPIPNSGPLAVRELIPVILARRPQDVAVYAGKDSNAATDGDWIVIDGPEAVLVEAGKYVTVPGYQTPGQTTPEQPTPGQTSVTTQTPTVTPTWVWPVVIGGIALVLVGAAVVSRPQRASYGMNSKKRKGYQVVVKQHGKTTWIRGTRTKREANEAARVLRERGNTVTIKKLTRRGQGLDALIEALGE